MWTSVLYLGGLLVFGGLLFLWPIRGILFGLLYLVYNVGRQDYDDDLKFLAGVGVACILLWLVLRPF